MHNFYPKNSSCRGDGLTPLQLPNWHLYLEYVYWASIFNRAFAWGKISPWGRAGAGTYNL